MQEREHLRQLGQLLQCPDLAWDSSPVEQLESLLTYHWLEKARRASRRLFRSPPYAQVKPLPLGGRALYTYERSLWPQPLETVSSPAGWACEALLCRNLAAAYWTGLASLRDMLDRPLTVRSWEVQPELLELMSGRRWDWSAAFSQTTLHSSLAGGRADLFLINAVGWDQSEFLQAWSERPRGQAAVIWVDTSQTPGLDWDRLLQQLRADPPWLMVRAHSWQAWDSLGLNLSQPGQLTFYGPPATGLSTLATAGELSRRVRSVMGTSLTLPQLSEWCWPRDIQPYLEHLQQNWDWVAKQLSLSVGPDGTFRWPEIPPGQHPAVTEGVGVGCFGHRYRVDNQGVQVAVGWRDPGLLLEWLQGKGSAPGRSPRKLMAQWPADRRGLLRVADHRPPPSLEQLETRLSDYDSCPPPRKLRPLLMRSGMSALSAVWMALERMWSEPRPLRVAGLGRYFESKFLEQVVQGGGALELVPIDQADVVFAESVEYDWELTPLDLTRLRGVRALVLDTTLSGQRLGLARLFKELPQLEFAIRVFSGLKLDQQGLELENCGALLLAGPADWVGRAEATLIQARGCCGNDFSHLERGRLAPDFVLDPRLARQHGDAVFANNARLARRLKPGGLLARVSHPALGPATVPWAVAPFVVLHLCEPSIEAHGLVAAVLEREARLRGLALQRGASFGFVDPRHEFVIPVLKENRALFKVAMGAAPDKGVVDLLQEVLSYTSVAALQSAYPRLKAARAPSDWAAPSVRLIEFLEGPD